jgi:hypothetical protein
LHANSFEVVYGGHSANDQERAWAYGVYTKAETGSCHPRIHKYSNTWLCQERYSCDIDRDCRLHPQVYPAEMEEKQAKEVEEEEATHAEKRRRAMERKQWEDEEEEDAQCRQAHKVANAWGIQGKVGVGHGRVERFSRWVGKVRNWA